MKMLQMFLVILIAKNGHSEEIKDLSIPKLVALSKDVTKITPEEVKISDVAFYLVTRSVRSPTKLVDDNLNLLNLTKPTKFVIHGWLESCRITWYQNIADEFFKSMDINFIEVDWERPARFNYVSSASKTKEIGYYVSKFITDLNFPLQTTHLIGHSLGSHVAAFAAKQIYKVTGQKIKRISALDPAGPYFKLYIADSSKRLDKHDAKIVDVIHTDADANNCTSNILGFYGYELPIGSVDFYVNRGRRVQPGCLQHEDNYTTVVGQAVQSSFCSHSKSHVYFTEWINIGKFKCRFCTPLTVWLGENCILQNVVFIEEEGVNEHVNGVCYAITNLEPPYLSQS